MKPDEKAEGHRHGRLFGANFRGTVLADLGQRSATVSKARERTGSRGTDDRCAREAAVSLTRCPTAEMGRVLSIVGWRG